jgi:hypothetical protein
MTKLSFLFLVAVVSLPARGLAQQFAPDRSAVVVLNADDAPAELTDVQIMRNGFGTSEMVRVTVKNRTPDPLTVLRIDALVFNEKATLRMQAFGGGPIAGLGVRVFDVRVQHPEAKPEWKVVVAVKDANTSTRTWTVENEAIKTKARESLAR